MFSNATSMVESKIARYYLPIGNIMHDNATNLDPDIVPNSNQVCDRRRRPNPDVVTDNAISGHLCVARQDTPPSDSASMTDVRSNAHDSLLSHRRKIRMHSL